MKNKVYLQLLGFALFTGGTFNVSKYVVQYFSAVHIAAWRFGIAAFVMLCILIVRKNFEREIWKQNIGYYVLLGLVGVFGFNFFFFLGMKHTEAINGSLIMATNPLVTTILASVILRERIVKRQAIGMLFALLGVIFVITQGAFSALQNLAFSKGDFYILLGNICWGLYGVLGRKFIKNGNPLQTTTYTMTVGALAFIMVSFMQKSVVPIPEVPLFAWLSILFMAIGMSVLGYLWWNKGIAQIGAAKTSLFFNLVPVVTMLISFVEGVNITTAQCLGMILVITGVLYSSGFLAIKSKRESMNV
ncbi:EamA family transporter [Bacillus pseudomycoides]|uniref:EamA family transporter n=1 Tax=Bacillus pseudomycoides TaxID=64104 RepID=A0AA91ZSF4_9BACI|nr:MULTISPECIES: DMT family transporter [Bacillus]PEB48526.1 EamA family transporter [Bacillus sp. AFS098217]PED81626.1 EamA family transporter [Bacillus pseudomycoides]PEU07679.1 EamA family transporter [Bacillus sp. AFS019443]PEU16956.1 EamA family transporter [Bacillus sp. AFS014408]PFW61426.1 EamA family transporter [Bacillus sp. AFS075034]